ETRPPPDGFVDSGEPLMDKELRYGRVEVVESTAARVHVRWTYQSCDFTYKVWGDAAAEDFYFYPDGFGTRVLNLKTPPGSDYELSEFIILTPAAAYPFAVLPDHIVDVLYVDGEKREISAPFAVKGQTAGMRWPDDMIEKARHVPVVYRVRLQKENGPTAIYFNPLDTHLPPAIFGPFYDRGYMVTPVYWGSHWPLGRGKTTGYAIDNRIYVSPAHNSVMSWARNRPTPLSVTTEQGIDTLGRSKTLVVQKWVWLIGMSDAPDERLLGWAGSFSRPPSLELKGARLDFDSYVPERRAIRLKIEDSTADILIKPVQVPPTKCVNPVFELSGIRGALLDVTVAGRILEPGEYAWDGRTLWLNLTAKGAWPNLLEFCSILAAKPSEFACQTARFSG
ncbi:MAG: hypothetical protein M1608_18515, partial [Candidatus Omnitrophica bacterium]|nr:hypothetical protein [Candidatus Omnitrophota bacterium]